LQLCVGDELPDKVCTECAHQVNTSYNFKLQCETSDVTLRQMLLRGKVRYCVCVCIHTVWSIVLESTVFGCIL